LGVFNAKYVGGAAGYCLRVRKISITSFYTHSLSVYLGKNLAEQINESA